MFRWLAGLVVIAALAFGVLYIAAGRSAPPRLAIEKPDRVIGQTGAVEVTAEAPNARFTAFTIALEQNGKSYPLYALDNAAAATVTPVNRNTLHVSRPIGKQAVPQLVSGTARIVVSATRPSFLNLRQVTSSASKEFQVRLQPPPIPLLSPKHHR